jgi:hypothetical protein
MLEITTCDSFALINPATALPMIGGVGGVDVAGNPWGCNLRIPVASCEPVGLG